MYIERELREELKALSMEIFGKSSAYQALLKGVTETVMEKKIETVPGENGAEPTTKEVEVPKLTKAGAPLKQIKYYTPEEVKAKFLEFKKQQDFVKAELKRHQDELEAKKKVDEQSQKVHEDASGSAY